MKPRNSGSSVGLQVMLIVPSLSTMSVHHFCNSDLLSGERGISICVWKSIRRDCRVVIPPMAGFLLAMTTFVLCITIPPCAERGFSSWYSVNRRDCHVRLWRPRNDLKKTSKKNPNTSGRHCLRPVGSMSHRVYDPLGPAARWARELSDHGELVFEEFCYGQ